ncbi:MAG: hypothetical protein IPM07_05125 [Anaerolineales bacterium]|nr:hypothetical protein [Anaerolineales bacterium]
MVTLPGEWPDGRLAGHAPLLSTFDIGEIVLHKRDEKQFIAVSGGVVEVRPDKVTILADAAEPGSNIDGRKSTPRERRRFWPITHRRSRCRI